MPNLSIKDVPEDIAQALRERAARNHRSLQGELMAIIEAAVQPPPTPPAAPGFPEAASRFHSRFSRTIPDPLGSAAVVREMRDTHYGEAWVMARVKDGHWPSQPGESEPLGHTVYCVKPKRPA
ncbi:FitA-like ribbon-helix-helix domain-containing protein [Sulfuricystis multivorans]|uniref:FitA-like ribbon-helix-helix domain-containing protein n=1 Tax=Sulfuricystis multivorans TaxID=2211108 RepID=UPI000F8369C7|nr:Arc family DNA-binding protein [Sulfuricystis multivorans]